MDIKSTARQCKKASVLMAAISGQVKNRALKNIISSLDDNEDLIFKANNKDLENGKKENLEPALVKRLKFDSAKKAEACEGIESLVNLEDPVGKTLAATELDKGLELFKVSRPIGVIGVIFESRPDALVQIAALCLKSANAVLLKGGREACETNQVLADLISKAGIEAGLPQGWLGLLETRSDVEQMLSLENFVDLIIPRGSNEFVRYIMDNTVIPVLGHADGICHVYIDKDADLKKAVELCLDSKCQYAAACNAAETILVHETMAKDLLTQMQKQFKLSAVKIYGCERTCEFIDVEKASEKAWQTEYLDLTVSIKIVSSMENGVDHINEYGSGHTDVIVTENRRSALYFMDHVDSADVFVNCSTRFSDGFRFGLGAEVGISTGKIHARGPVGLEGLMSSQWRLIGDGHIVKDYAGLDAKLFTHKKLNRDFYLK